MILDCYGTPMRRRIGYLGGLQREPLEPSVDLVSGSCIKPRSEVGEDDEQSEVTRCE